MSLRVRFAPSPTGFLHVGGARTALFNWLLARKEGGSFVLRIEDTDRERSSEEHTRAILEGMTWLGLDWDEGPHFQSGGIERHRIEAERLVHEGRAYRDFTPVDEEEAAEPDLPDPGIAEERAAAGEPHAIRFRVPEGETRWDDLVHGEMRWDNADIGDLVILRRDRSPTYNFAVVCDDAEMRISHVIRGDDHLSNTPKQILLYEALGFPVPRFAHVPMILGPDGKRLSKRHGATAVGEYAHQGILPQAMVNFLALLGWSPGDDREVLTVDELVQAFSLERVLKKSSVFDPAKLEWLNGQHLMRMSAEELAPLVTEKLLERGHLTRTVVEGLATRGLEGGGPPAEAAAERGSWFCFLIDLLKVRARTIDEMAAQAEIYLLDGVGEYDPDVVKKQWEKDPEGAAGRLEALASRLSDASWKEDTLESELRALAAELGVGAGKLIHPLRLALTGSGAGPGIFEVLVLLGRERSLARIEAALRRIRGGDEPATRGSTSP